MVSVSGYLIGTPVANKLPLPPVAELAWWYQYYFATERGQLGYNKYRREFARLIWQIRIAGSGTWIMLCLNAPPPPSTIRIMSAS